MAMQLLYLACGVGALVLLIMGAADNYTYVVVDKES